jgi:hypothetical protein
LVVVPGAADLAQALIAVNLAEAERLGGLDGRRFGAAHPGDVGDDRTQRCSESSAWSRPSALSVHVAGRSPDSCGRAWRTTMNERSTNENPRDDGVGMLTAGHGYVT